MIKFTPGISGPEGLHITFDNGNTISIQFGPGNYCDNKMKSFDSPTTGSKNAEITIWDSEGAMHCFGQFKHDTVKGWLSANEITYWMNWAANNSVLTADHYDFNEEE